jgi:DNA-binding MarR family transcriptional regulator/DNA-binding transcriptional MerR regulator
MARRDDRRAARSGRGHDELVARDDGIRIGEAAARTGLSARMIRAYERRGWARAARRADHRRYADAEVARLRLLRALLAAGVDADRAARLLDDHATTAERDEAMAALVLLFDEVSEAVTALDEPDPDGDLPEQHISLMFDTFMVRTRMECVLSAALRPAGIPSGEYAIVSLIWAEGSMTPATLGRLVGVAPSTLGGRIANVVRRGWVRRVPDPADRRSWRLELTPEGDRLMETAIPHAHTCAVRIDQALQERGTHPDTVRASLLTLSAALRSLLPDRP